MVLHVAFEDFADTVKRVVGDSSEAYAASENGVTILTASAAGEGTVVASVTKSSVEEAKVELQKAGLRVFEGRWTDDLMLEKESVVLTDVFVSGVSYKTEAGAPGIWVDAYPVQPSKVQVLKAMYEEMLQTGEMANVPFEEFVRLSDANVVIVSPQELRTFVSQKLAGSEVAEK